MIFLLVSGITGFRDYTNHTVDLRGQDGNISKRSFHGLAGKTAKAAPGFIDHSMSRI